MSVLKPWPAPAKLNLLLRITGRRPDGYHNLQTVFQFLDWHDELRFVPRADGGITRVRSLPGVPEEQDLCLRAARLLQQETGVRHGVTIDLHKRVPMGGGLGGGSSDAATVLVALNRIWDIGLADQELADIGLALGADVPVFVHGRAAWAEGVGERLTFFEPPAPWYLVVLPQVSVATGGIFGDPGLTRDSPVMKIADFIAGVGGNDCEAVVRRRYPQVAAALDWLSAFGEARLTGTGACVFLGLPSRDRALQVAGRVPPPWRGFAARGLNRSPLAQRLLEGV